MDNILKAEFTKFDTTSQYVSGICGDFKFEAKLFDVGSSFGINNGRVSKLWISDANKKCVTHYDRGWDVKVKKVVKPVFKAVMELLENSPKRF